MPREVVIFDTNALRSVGRRHVDELVAAHRKHSIASLASTIVALELISAIGGADPVDAVAGLNGVVALTRLTQIWDHGTYIPFVRSPIDQRLVAFDNTRSDEAFVRWLGTFLLRLAEVQKLPLEPELAEACEEIRAWVLAREEAYGASLAKAASDGAELMKAHANVESDREAQLETMRFLRERGSTFTAEILAMFHPHIDEDSPESILAPEAEWMLEHAGTSIAFIHNQLVLSAGGEIDPSKSKHANSVWDSHVCALIDHRALLRPGNVFFGAPVYVVSSERQIVRAAEASGARGRLRRLGEHCARVGLGGLAAEKRWV
ncbi:MAG: hypothetical protein K2R93_08835 [Gemmatimonadaceae bacterium]|nr:hypothetical protein [Gemmatimonadaceae bacterium]